MLSFGVPAREAAVFFVSALHLFITLHHLQAQTPIMHDDSFKFHYKECIMHFGGHISFNDNPLAKTQHLLTSEHIQTCLKMLLASSTGRTWQQKTALVWSSSMKQGRLVHNRNEGVRPSVLGTEFHFNQFRMFLKENSFWLFEIQTFRLQLFFINL